MIFLMGCTSPDQQNADVKTVTTVCLFSLCEHESADHTHGETTQDEGEEADVDAELSPVEAGLL